MLQIPQEDVILAQLVDHRLRQQFERDQARHGLPQRGDLKLGIPAAADQLERLDHEFDLADPAAPQLDVVVPP